MLTAKEASAVQTLYKHMRHRKCFKRMRVVCAFKSGKKTFEFSGYVMRVMTTASFACRLLSLQLDLECDEKTGAVKGVVLCVDNCGKKYTAPLEDIVEHSSGPTSFAHLSKLDIRSILGVKLEIDSSDQTQGLVVSLNLKARSKLEFGFLANFHK